MSLNLNVLIVGTGQMGLCVAAELSTRGHQIAGKIGSTDDLDSVLDKSLPNIAIEFSVPSAAKNNVSKLIRAGVPVVCGTTGWEPDSLSDLLETNNGRLLFSANFSIGVAVMKKLTSLAATTLAPFPEFEPALFERHHNRKKDAPSGTARMLGEVVSNSNENSTMPITSVRQGGAAGEHTLIFEGEAETLEITHRANSRRIFAIGAVRAAEWLVQQKETGFFSFETFLEGSLQWPVNV